MSSMSGWVTSSRRARIGKRLMSCQISMPMLRRVSVSSLASSRSAERSEVPSMVLAMYLRRPPSMVLSRSGLARASTDLPSFIIDPAPGILLATSPWVVR